MTLHRLLAMAAVGLGLGLLVPSLAHAYPAFTTGGVNVRMGPSASFPKITTLARGTPVDVRFCQPGWCQVGFWGGTGWVSARYLHAGGGQYAAPGLYFRFNFGSPPRRWQPGPFVNPWPDPYPRRRWW